VIIENEVDRILKSVLRLDFISEDLGITNNEAWDSLNHIILMIAIKDFFDIELNNTEVVEVTNRKALIGVIKQKLIIIDE
jgi:acyl carrier protein